MNLRSLQPNLVSTVVVSALFLAGSRLSNGQVSEPPKQDPDARYASSRAWANSIGMEFVWIPAGEFVMGSESEHAPPSELPLTRVRISKGYWLGKYEVTQGQWEEVRGGNPSYFWLCGWDCPVERVSWEDVQDFIGRLNESEGTGKYRLPTEAEWEYAARAGMRRYTYPEHMIYPPGHGSQLALTAFFWRGAGRRTQRVGLRAPNEWGLHDMLGNAWEWVQDRYGSYGGGLVTDPKGPSAIGPKEGIGRVTRAVRGGSWCDNVGHCRAAHRSIAHHQDGNTYLGFRLTRIE